MESALAPQPVRLISTVPSDAGGLGLAMRPTGPHRPGTIARSEIAVGRSDSEAFVCQEAHLGELDRIWAEFLRVQAQGIVALTSSRWTHLFSAATTCFSRKGRAENEERFAGDSLGQSGEGGRRVHR